MIRALKMPFFSTLLALLCLGAFRPHAEAQIQLNPLAPIIGNTNLLDVGDVRIKGVTGFIGSYRSGIMVYDLSNERHPRLVNQFKGTPPITYDGITCFELHEDKIYLVDNTRGLVVADIVDATNFVVTTPYSYVVEPPISLQFKDNLLFTISPYRGIEVIDITQTPLTTNSVVGHCDTEGNATSMLIASNYAYVSTTYGDLQIVDVSNPHHPEQVALHQRKFFYDFRIAVAGNYAYVASKSDDSFNAPLLRVMDISDPENVIEVGNVPHPEGTVLSLVDSVYQVEVKDSTVYLSSSHGLSIIDVSDPTTPQLLFHDKEMRGLFQVTDDRLWVGPIAYDIHDLRAPKMLRPGFINLNFRFQTAAQGKLLYAVNQLGLLAALDLSNPDDPILFSHRLKNYTPMEMSAADNHDDIIIDGYRLYAKGRYLIKIFDISNPEQIEVIHDEFNHSSLLSQLYPLFYWNVQNHQLTACSAGRGLRIFDVQDPANPITLLDNYRTYSIEAGLRQGDRFYGITTSSNFIVLDLSVPSAPKQVGQSTEKLTGSKIHIQGEYAYVWGEYKYDYQESNPTPLKIVDLRDPAQPKLVGEYPVLTKNLRVKDDIAYIAGDMVGPIGAQTTNGLTILDISNPATPAILAQYTGHQVVDLTLLDNLVLTIDAKDRGDLHIFETFGLHPTSPDIRPGSLQEIEGERQFGFRTSVPAAYTIESTTDFITWKPLNSITATNSRTRFTVPATNEIEFYRVSKP